MDLNKSIFRSYDIRGIYPLDLNEDGASHIGRAFGTMLSEKSLSRVAVGRDNRSSSPALAKAFIGGLVSTGARVTDVGISVTPIIHFLSFMEEFDAAVIVTASHNPKEYNGFRIDYSRAEPLYGREILTLCERVSRENYTAGKGVILERDLFPLYLENLKKKFSFKKRLKVVIDCGNGTSSFFAPRIFQDLGCEVVPLYCDSDGDYPHGTPDPENRVFLGDLQRKVLENEGAVGFAFDTDMDRIGVVDEKGSAFDNDKLLLLFASVVLETNPKAKIIYDVKSSSVLEEFIRANGGYPEMMRTGHPYFMEAMKKGALLAGEFSGHTYFGGEYYGFDDGIYAACKVLEILEQAKEPLSELMSIFPKRYHTSEVKLSCSDNQKFGLIDTLTSTFLEIPNLVSVKAMDGVRVQVTKTGWFLIRAANTSPKLSIRLEGGSRDEAELMRKRVKEVLSPFQFVDVSPLDLAEIYFS